MSPFNVSSPEALTEAVTQLVAMVAKNRSSIYSTFIHYLKLFDFCKLPQIPLLSLPLCAMLAAAFHTVTAVPREKAYKPRARKTFIKAREPEPRKPS